MLYQDRRALRCVRNRIMWVASVVVCLPIAQAVPQDVLAIGALSATGALLVAYMTMLASITR